MRCRRLLAYTLFKHQEPRLRPPKSSFPASHLSDATDYPSNLSRSSLAAGLLLAFVALFATTAQAQTTDPLLSATITVGETPEEVGGDYRGYAEAAITFLDDDVGSIDNGEFSYSGTDNRVQLMSGDPRVVQIILAELLVESVEGLVLEFAGEEFPFADAQKYYAQFLWDQSWLNDNAPSLNTDCFATTLPLGGTAGVCLRTTGQTCPPTTSSSAQICPAPASAQASATPAAAARPKPKIVLLKARFRDVPEEHDGSTAFTLQLAFNEPIRTTQEAIQQALMVTGGTVTSARQVDGRRKLWEITVTPNSNADVNISLPSTTSCVAGAVCTADGRTLSRSVAVSVPRAPLRVRFESLPAGHDGSTAFAVQLAFSEPIETTEAAIRQMLMVTHGTVTSVRQVDGRSDLWETKAIPHSNDDVSMSLLATPSCDADNAICTADGRMLSQGVAVSVPRAPLRVRFESLPTGHDGSTAFALQLVFSEPIWLTAPALRTALTVTGGRVTGTRRVKGRSDLWKIIIQPNANDVYIALPPTTSCNANGAVCTQDGLVLQNDAQVVIPLATQTGEDAQPEVEPLMARFESLPAGHDGTTEFAVQLVFSEPIERTKAAEIQQALAVIGGAVASARRVNGRSDRWETTIQPNPNDVRIALPPTPSCEADNAICTADGRMLSQGVAASVVYRAPLTARFESLPTGHDGTTPFAVQLAFNEPIWLTEAVMRTQALTVTGGRVTSARRVDGRSDRWKIIIQPDANDVRIALSPTTSCNANGAICTQDGHALSNGLSATVTGPAAKSVAALQAFALYANYPNPFNAETQMTYALPVAGAVELAIYNVRGQRVRTLVQGVQAAGRYQIVWDGRNDTGAALASGVYLSRLASTQGVRVRQLLLIK